MRYSYGFLFCFIVLLSCNKNDEKFPSVDGEYKGKLVTNTQIVFTGANTWDTTIGTKIVLQRISDKLLPIKLPFYSKTDTLLKEDVNSSEYPQATHFYYKSASDGTSGMIYYVYFFAGSDSVYIHAFPPPGNGHSQNFYFYGKLKN